MSLRRARKRPLSRPRLSLKTRIGRGSLLIAQLIGSFRHFRISRSHTINADFCVTGLGMLVHMACVVFLTSPLGFESPLGRVFARSRGGGNLDTNSKTSQQKSKTLMSRAHSLSRGATRNKAHLIRNGRDVACLFSGQRRKESCVCALHL